MDKDLQFWLLVILIVAGYIQAYQWGWSNGHDVHHEEPEHGPRTPPPAPTLWR